MLHVLVVEHLDLVDGVVEQALAVDVVVVVDTVVVEVVVDTVVVAAAAVVDVVDAGRKI